MGLGLQLGGKGWGCRGGNGWECRGRCLKVWLGWGVLKSPPGLAPDKLELAPGGPCVMLDNGGWGWLLLRCRCPLPSMRISLRCGRWDPCVEAVGIGLDCAARSAPWGWDHRRAVVIRVYHRQGLAGSVLHTVVAGAYRVSPVPKQCRVSDVCRTDQTCGLDETYSETKNSVPLLYATDTPPHDTSNTCIRKGFVLRGKGQVLGGSDLRYSIYNAA
jgi:hypothetical protein